MEDSAGELLLHDAMDPLSEALLMFAARREHVQQVILPGLARGEVVISDRFTDATFAYQGHGRGFDLRVLQTLERWVQLLPGQDELLEPELCFWFDLSPSIAAARLVGARSPDKFESESEAFFARVAGGYAARMAQAPQRFVRIDASQAPKPQNPITNIRILIMECYRDCLSFRQKRLTV